VVSAKFVTVEGIEGSGKTTLLSGLVMWLAARGIEVVTTREPGGTVLGNRLRTVFVEPGLPIAALAEAFVVNASRAQHVEEVIEPALQADRWVLCDRFADATLAYQGYGRGLDLAVLRSLADVATRGRRPDLTFLVDVSADVSHARVLARTSSGGASPDRLERETSGFHERVRAGYLTLARDDRRFVTLDGNQPPDDVLRAASRVLAEKFGV
jgi:dTMP kinase